MTSQRHSACATAAVRFGGGLRKVRWQAGQTGSSLGCARHLLLAGRRGDYFPADDFLQNGPAGSNRRKPVGPTRALLKVAAEHPEAVRSAL